MSESSTIQIGQREIQYALTEASGVKTVRLKLNPDLKLEISIPSGSSVDVSALLKRKRDWIERKYDQILNSKRVFDGERILYRGKYREGLSKEWLRDETTKVVRDKLREFSDRYKLSFNNFVVKDTRKWAYCT